LLAAGGRVFAKRNQKREVPGDDDEDSVDRELPQAVTVQQRHA